MMDSLERRLVELNQALLQITNGQDVDAAVLQRAQQALYGIDIDTGPGDDVVIINKHIYKKCDDQGNVPGAQGPQGPQGEPGPQGPQGSCTCAPVEYGSAILVSDDYEVEDGISYVGVDADGPVTITLPPCDDTTIKITIKAEMGPPLGNRKVTIETGDNSTIDGEDEYVLTTPWESITLVCHNGNWFTV